ncbi:dehydrogenase [Synechococcus sp. CS-1325]|uniref:dehydrogenase n=1 Tax=Synechococcus sp. CS-1325 TaxID=2847979 RepID=UPI00223B5D8E|nr:dehydrogenase [Synechococcus sp. CS-1325]MCT0198087.1 dehydrogenase [Synechococcus sp. CS-1325]
MRPSPGFQLALLALLSLILATAVRAPAIPAIDPLTGPRAALNKDWIGRAVLPENTAILVMAGHADSQAMAGAGTPGEAVARFGAAPMDPLIRDELHWNLLTAQRVVSLAQQRGLNVSLYVPPQRTIADGDDPRTNWSVGKAFAQGGGYALEIHFDAYGPDGFGSGLIPPLHRPFSRLDESLAAAFGAYSANFREGLGAPRRGIAILEIGKLEGSLEAALRDPTSREVTLNAIATRVVDAFAAGLSPRPDGAGNVP